MAQKRKAEDEVSAMGNEELGDTAAPAAKKVKAESDERTPLPATTVAAARDGGMASTTADTNKASNTPALPAPSFAASAGAEVASAHSDSLAAATAADSDIKAEPELAEAGAKPEVAEAKQEDAEAKPEDADADMADEYAEDPQTLGYKTFKSGDEAFQYFHDLMHNLRQNQDLNEYESNAVMDLLKKGHPHSAEKIGSGIRALQVREHLDMDSVCFHIMRVDSTMENFSTRKCVAKLFPGWGRNNLKKKDRENGGRGIRGGGRIGRGGRRGRGGRGGRGRGRGRG